MRCSLRPVCLFLFSGLILASASLVQGQDREGDVEREMASVPVDIEALSPLTLPYSIAYEISKPGDGIWYAALDGQRNLRSFLRKPSVLKPTALEAPEEAIGPKTEPSYEFQESFKQVTETSSFGVSASVSSPFFSAAGSYNRTAFGQRSDEKVYMAAWVRSDTHKIEIPLDTLSKPESFKDEVHALRREALSSLSGRGVRPIDDVRREFQSKYGDGLVLLLRRGAMFHWETSKKVSAGESRDDVKAELTASYIGFKASVETSTSREEINRDQHLAGSGVFVGGAKKIPEGMSVADFISYMNQGSGWIAEAQSNPATLEAVTIPYAAVPYLRPLLALNTSANDPDARLLEHFGSEQYPDSGVILRYTEGWSTPAWGVVPYLFPTGEVVVEEGKVAISFGVDPFVERADSSATPIPNGRASAWARAKAAEAEIEGYTEAAAVGIPPLVEDAHLWPVLLARDQSAAIAAGGAEALMLKPPTQRFTVKELRNQARLGSGERFYVFSGEKEEVEEFVAAAKTGGIKYYTAVLLSGYAPVKGVERQLKLEETTLADGTVRYKAEAPHYEDSTELDRLRATYEQQLRDHVSLVVQGPPKTVRGFGETLLTTWMYWAGGGRVSVNQCHPEFTADAGWERIGGRVRKYSVGGQNGSEALRPIDPRKINGCKTGSTCDSAGEYCVSAWQEPGCLVNKEWVEWYRGTVSRIGIPVDSAFICAATP